MSLYAQTVPQFIKMLGNLDSWLDQAVTFSEAREMDPELLITRRLYPDQYDLTRQIQAACDTAKLTGARLADVDAPKHEDGPSTLAELRQRIADVRAFLGDLDAATIDAAAETRLSPGFLQGMQVTGANYAREFGIPNFYFHITTAYAILRHTGVKLGKRTYLGSMELIKPE